MPTGVPRYRTWIRTPRVVVFAVLTGLGLAGTSLAVVSPWFLLFVVPTALFAYVTAILVFTWYRLAPRGGNAQDRIHELIVERANPRARSDMLDIGCGSGALAIKLAQAQTSATVVGVDSWGPNWQYSKAQCERNARIEGVEAQTTFSKQSGAHLEFGDDTFDVVVSCMTFHEIRDATSATAAVAEALRVLRPGGRFVFVDPFADPAYYPSTDDLRSVIDRAGASLTEFVALGDALPLPFPLRHPKVLGRAMLLVGTSGATRGGAAHRAHRVV
ncbi:MAG TPA: class I SAM-dependent methyltransferase [Ilumatobacteraceae bacterium]